MKNALFSLLKLHKEKLFSWLAFKENKYQGSNEGYLFLPLPLLSEQYLTINGCKMTIQEHHLSIPEKIKANEKSEYHYTLILLAAGKQYKVHIYFNSQDNLTLEPSLYEEDKGIFDSFQPIANKDEENKIILFCANQVSPIISRIRGEQAGLINDLHGKISANEAELSALSSNIEKNKVKYTEIITRQIALLAQLKAIGDPNAKVQINLYSQCLIHLSSMSSSPTRTPESRVAGDKDIKRKPVIKNKHPVKRQSPRQSHLAKQILSAKSLLEKYHKASNVEKFKLAQSLLDAIKVFDLSAGQSKDSDLLYIILQLKRALKNILGKMNLLQNFDIYVQAYHLGVAEVDLSCLKHILETDDAEKLERILTSSFTETLRVKLLDESEKNYNLVEWATYFRALECMKLLLRKGFSLHYLSEKDSPLLQVTGCAHFFSKVTDFVYLHNLDHLIDRLYHRSTTQLVEELTKLDPNKKDYQHKVEIIRLKIKLSTLQRKIFQAYGKNKALRATIKEGKDEMIPTSLDYLVNSPKISALFLDDPDILRAIIDINEGCLALTPLLKKGASSVIPKADPSDALLVIREMEQVDAAQLKSFFLASFNIQQQILILQKQIAESNLEINPYVHNKQVHFAMVGSHPNSMLYYQKFLQLVEENNRIIAQFYEAMKDQKKKEKIDTVVQTLFKQKEPELSLFSTEEVGEIRDFLATSLSTAFKALSVEAEQELVKIQRPKPSEASEEKSKSLTMSHRLASQSQSSLRSLCSSTAPIESDLTTAVNPAMQRRVNKESKPREPICPKRSS